MATRHSPGEPKVTPDLFMMFPKNYTKQMLPLVQHVKDLSPGVLLCPGAPVTSLVMTQTGQQL